MAVITYTVGSGQTYANLAAAVAALPANIVTDGNSYVLEMYSSELAFSPLTITNTCDATHNITIKPAAGLSFRDAAISPLAYRAAAGITIAGGVASATLLSLKADYTVIQDLQIAQTNTSGRIALQLYNANCSVTGCIIDGYMDTSSNVVLDLLGTNTVAKNCVIVLRGSAGTNAKAIEFGYGGQQLLGCTVVQPSDASIKVAAFTQAGGTITIKDCAIFGFGSLGTLTTVNADGHNVTDLATAPGSTGNLVSKSYSNQFINTTLASLDLTPKAGADLIGSGSPDAALTVDIARVTRANPPSVGAMESTNTTPVAAPTNLNIATQITSPTASFVPSIQIDSMTFNLSITSPAITGTGTVTTASIDSIILNTSVTSPTATLVVAAPTNLVLAMSITKPSAVAHNPPGTFDNIIYDVVLTILKAIEREIIRIRT